jgi:hypothetical protein
MQEAGATSRAQMQEAGATARTGMQIQGQQAMQAAELEAEDRRSAEAEASKREDQRYNRMLQEDQQAFLAEQSRLEQEFSAARDQKNYDREDAAIDRMLDNVTLQSMIDAESSKQRDKVILSIAKMSQKGETAKQRLITALSDDAERDSRTAEVHDNMKTRTAQAASLDRRMDAPIGGTVGIRKTKERAEAPQMPFGTAPTTTTITRKTEYIEPGSAADPMGVLQDQMRGNGSKLSIGSLMSGTGQDVARQVSSGELKKSDIQAAASTLDGMIEALEQRKADATGNLETGFWRRNLNDVKRMRVNLSRLMHDTTKVGENGQVTVGSVVRDALGPIDGLSSGSRVSKMKEFYAASSDSAEAYLSELGRAIEVPGLLAPPEGASDYLLDLVDRRNQARMSAFPDLLSSEER